MIVFKQVGLLLTTIGIGYIAEGNLLGRIYWIVESKILHIFFKDFTQNPTHILHIFTQIFRVCKVSSIEVDLLETGVKRCPDGLEIESVTECKEACAYLNIPLSSNKFKEGKPCYKGGSHVCNQNGAFGRNAKLICKKPGNFKLTII